MNSKRYAFIALVLSVVLGVSCLLGPSYSDKPCSQDDDCEDQNPCTKDSCTEDGCHYTNDDTAIPYDRNECTKVSCKEGAAVHSITVNGHCGTGGKLVCDADGNCKGCNQPEDCEPDTQTPCTTYSCDNQICNPHPVAAGTRLDDSMTGGDCKVSQCDGMGGVEIVPDPTDAPLGSTQCTKMGCDGQGNITKTYEPQTTHCGTNSGLCFGAGECVSCSDGAQNGNETGVDCGGDDCRDTKKCPDGQHCSQGADCLSLVCNNKLCVSATCGDGVQNKGETDTDCGGDDCRDTKKCNDGQHCSQAADCLSLVCNNMLCIPATCGDGVPNNGETDIDCGGMNCPLCDGDHCASDAECKSGVCAATYCRTKVGGKCTENLQCATNRCNQGTCKTCAGNGHCGDVGLGDCVAGVCTVHAGGPCEAHANCASGACLENLCKIADYSPTGCADDTQCSSGNCNLICVPCTSDADCGDAGLACKNGDCLLPPNAYCTQHAQCNSGTCAGFPPRCQ